MLVAGDVATRIPAELQIQSGAKSMTHGSLFLRHRWLCRHLTLSFLICTVLPVFGQTTPPAPADSDSAQATEQRDAEVEAAISDLSSSKFGKRQSAHRRLVKIGPPAIDPLVEAAQEESLDVSVHCVEILVQIARDKNNRAAVVTALQRLATDSSSKVAKLASQHAAEMQLSNEERAIAALEAAGVRIFRFRDQVYSVDLQRDREISHLRHLPTLRTVTLEGPRITDAGLQALSSARKVETLTLNNTSASPRGFQHLGDLPNLSSLSLMSMEITAESMRSIGELTGLRNLSVFVELDDRQLEHLIAVRQLTRLYLTSIEFTTETTDIINRLADLDDLHLSVSDVDDDLCHDLAAIRHPVSLSLTRSPKITDAGWAHLKPSNIRSISVMRTPLSDDALASLAEIPNLSSLRIYDSPVTDEGLMKLQSAKSLRSLSLRGTKVTQAAADQLQRLMPQLRTIRLDSNPLLARRRIPNLPAIRFLEIRGRKNAHLRGKLTDEVFEKLKSEPTVDTVFMSRGEATDAEVARLATLPLKGVVVYSEKITDKVTAAWKGHSTLQSISLQSSALTDACLEPLGDIPGLKKVMISEAAITDDGVQTLIDQLATKEDFDWLSLRRCRELTNEAFQGIDRLRKLEHLFIDNNPKLDSNVLIAVGKVQGLQQLGIGTIQIDTPDLAHLKGLKLNRLSLGDSLITSRGVEEMVSLFPDLTSLEGSAFTDDDMFSIAKLSKLTSLSMIKSQVSDEGLARLDGLSELKFLMGNKATISEFAKRQFESAHPGANVMLSDIP